MPTKKQARYSIRLARARTKKNLALIKTDKRLIRDMQKILAAVEAPKLKWNKSYRRNDYTESRSE